MFPSVEPLINISAVVDKLPVRLDLKMKRFIREKVAYKLKPSQILNAMIAARIIPIDWNAQELLLPVTRYAYHYRTKGLSYNNAIDETELILKMRTFHPNLADTTAFAFGFPTNSTDQPILSRGTAARPLVIGFSTKIMMRNMKYASDYVFHVDATFKLHTARFPAVIIGVSDVLRHFHPVAFFIVSDIRQRQLEAVFHETFKMYKTITGATPRIGYAMADADIAQRNALEIVVAQDLHQATPPVYLMCFFHVMQNVRKYMASVPPETHPKIIQDVYGIHYARSVNDLDERVAVAVTVWKTNLALREFERVFSQQWLSGRFTRWYCVASPPGYAKTNNPVEQFNRAIKRDYSLRSLLSVNGLAQAFLDMSHHCSCRVKPFNTSPIPSNEQIARFRMLQKGGMISVKSHHPGSIEFLMEGRGVCVYQTIGQRNPHIKNKVISTQAQIYQADEEMEIIGEPNADWIVDVSDSSCFCSNMSKMGYCVHLIAARLHQDLPVEGVQVKRTFEVKGRMCKKGRPSNVVML